MITAQNHGFAVDEASMPANLRVTHKSLFDGTLQAFIKIDKLARSALWTLREAPLPGTMPPHRCSIHFIELIKQHRQSAKPIRS